MAFRKCQVAGADELPPQRFVLLLRGLHDLVVQGAQRVPHAVDCRVHRPRQRRVDPDDGFLQASGLIGDLASGVLDCLFHCRWKETFEEAVQRRFVLRLQPFKRDVVPIDEPEGGRVEQRRARAVQE